MSVEPTLRVEKSGKPISPDLFGIFFEDLNYAADGGLYAELIQNRSFEYDATEQPTWNALSFWEVVRRGSGKGGLWVDKSLPIHPNNPHYAVLHVSEVGEGVGILNPGFDGIPVKAGEKYDVSFFARQLYMGDRWGPGSIEHGDPMPVVVRLESEKGVVLGETKMAIAGRAWKRFAGVIRAKKTDAKARFVLLLKARGGVALDEISLFPRKTFRGRANGLRADLAQVIADLRPRFIRFPGGCLAHGNGVNNMYRWKDTIGPIEQRRGQANLWGYHQSVGLGYFEYFQFCEDIGAKPLPVVPAGVSCQNSGHTAGMGQQGIPMADMPAYIQDVLDLIEWANGPADSAWGSKRAAAGHPKPFGLEYLGVGNEDHITPVFRERFKLIYDAVKAKHPEITVIGTVGPFHSGQDYDDGWKIADELKVPMVDEHYYEKPEWFLQNLPRYDAYDRSRSAVYLGEYAAHEPDRRNTMRTALAEAAYLTALERNGDVVRLASYAPLLCKIGHAQWRPDLIYFDNTRVCRTVNYYVQQLFSLNAGDEYLPVTCELPASCVRDRKSGDLILKLVNGSDRKQAVGVEMLDFGRFQPKAELTLLAGKPDVENEFGRRPSVVPRKRPLSVGASFRYVAPPHSLSIIRMKRAKGKP